MLLFVMWVCHCVARTETYSGIARYLIATRRNQGKIHYAVCTERMAVLTLLSTPYWLPRPSFNATCTEHQGEAGYRDSRY
jgi:hypothetical protein